MPYVIVIAGSNGAGTYTLAPYLLPETLGILAFVVRRPGQGYKEDRAEAE